MAAPGIDPVRKATVRKALYRAGHERTVAGLRATLPASDRRTGLHAARGSSLPAIALSCYGDISEVQQQWQDFETHAIGTLYQKELWCRAWLETAGAALGASPRIILARDGSGQLRFVLPFQVRRRQGVRVLEWLGSPHHNYGFGLYDPAFMSSAEEWFSANWISVIEAAGEWDAVSLTEMPSHLFGRRNPMRPAFNMRGANASFLLHLESDFDELDKRKRSSERRRTARKSEAALARQVDISFGLPQDLPATHVIIDTMFAQQQQRLAELGIHGVFGPAERQFIHRLADLQDPSSPLLAPYHLKCGPDVQSVMLGGIHANGYWALISSLAAGPYRRFSPGDIALRRTIAACCTRGLDFFDFSAGDTPYKRQWSDETIPLFQVIKARNLKGLAWCSAMALRVLVKRTIKQTPLLLAASQALRKLVLGKRTD